MHFNNRINNCLEVIQVGDIIEQGVTMPVRCTLSGRIDAIVKYPKNPGGLEVLIDEWVGNSIADVIGLTIPRYGLCHLSADVIENTNRNYEIDIENAGLSFFSVLLENTVPANHNYLRSAQNRETEKILLFDHLIGNEDRHEGNLICKVSKPSIVFFIDCSHFLAVDGHYLNRDLDMSEELSEQKILDPKLLRNVNRNVYNLLCETQGYKEETLWSESNYIKQTITDSLLEEIRLSIPDEWVVTQTEKRIQDMFTILKTRFSMIDRITEMIAEERRRA